MGIYIPIKHHETMKIIYFRPCSIAIPGNGHPTGLALEISIIRKMPL
jgi:hypothetical protein